MISDCPYPRRDLITDYWWLMTDDWLLMTDDWLLIIDDWWLMTDDWWLMTDDWWLMTDDWLFADLASCGGDDGKGQMGTTIIPTHTNLFSRGSWKLQ